MKTSSKAYRHMRADVSLAQDHLKDAMSTLNRNAQNAELSPQELMDLWADISLAREYARKAEVAAGSAYRRSRKWARQGAL